MHVDPALLEYLTPEERQHLDALLAGDRIPWRPLPGPQSVAFESEADIVGYGGAAGGGKTDLACGLALSHHRKVGFFRLHATELTGVLDRFTELLGTRDGYNGRDNIWRTTRHDGVPIQIEFGSFPNVDDEKKYQGRPHDLLVFDEAANMRESAVRFLLGWLRTTVPGQQCQALLNFNPPTTADGRWVVKFFAPWLERGHPRPAGAGELRWFATVDGEDREMESSAPFEYGGETITPLSRTFIPSRIHDNPHLVGTGYMAQLQALPEPLRSQMLYGDFQAGMEDDPWQVIPTAWVELAMARWVKPVSLPPMDGVGIDVARGGKDQTVIARRHGMWFDEPLVYPGTGTPDGPTVAGLVVAAQRDQAMLYIDVIGVGSSPYDFLNEMGMPVIGVNVSEASLRGDKSGRLRFRNQRSELWWRMREALDPASNTGICLPRDERLLSDLCAPTWKLQAGTVSVASREDIVRTVGRSPDYASAYCLALMDVPKRSKTKIMSQDRLQIEYDPYTVNIVRQGGHNPYA